MSQYPFFEVEKQPEQKTAILYLNRPDKRNAMNTPFWSDLPKVVAELNADPEVRAVVVAAKGKSFTTGLDLEEFFRNSKDKIGAQDGDGREELMAMITGMQSGLNAIADVQTVFIAAVQKHCIGGGLDLATACDLRLCTKDAMFSLRETKVAIVADMGSLQRLPYIIGQGHTRMMALTGKDVKADEAYRMGLVNEVYETQDEMMAAAMKLATEIASNPVLAVRGAKEILNYGLNHTQQDGLKHVVLWNTAFIDHQDLREMLAAFVERRKPVFRD